jgi:Rap1a immunity proteins
MRKNLIVGALLLASAIDARAEFDTGNYFFSECRDEKNFRYEYCLGAAVAYADMLGELGRVCLPDGVTKGQTVDVVKKYMQDHLAERNKAAAGLAARALIAAWPCKTK